MKCDVAVIGAGPAGLAAALAAKQNGAGSVLVLERDFEAGGILNQCIHNGFGLHYFGEELTGPEYAGRFEDMLGQTDVQIMLDTMVLEITPERILHAVSPGAGLMRIEAGAVVLAMGCRERSRGAVGIAGTRPAGIFTAGTAQRYVNMDGYMVGRKVVILGSGDIGLIMARRMVLEGARVIACLEIMPYSSGLRRNIVQCLDDFSIPLYLTTTITEIKGTRRVEGVTCAKVGKDRKPLPGTEFDIDCDTVLLSAGLIPENELSQAAGAGLDRRTKGPIVYENMETTLPGIFACGNVAQVHDLVDFVTVESMRAGGAAAKYALGKRSGDPGYIEITNESGISYVLPQRARLQNVDKFLEVFFRVSNVFYNVEIIVESGGKKIAGYRREYAMPGEMEKIRIPAKLLTGDIRLSIKGGEPL